MKHPLQEVEQQSGEERVLVIRRHGYIFFQRTIILVALCAIPPLFLFVLIPAGWDAVLDQTSGGVLLVMGLSIYYLSIGLSFLHAWVDYYLDIWILSTKRIVNIEQRGLFSRVVSELLLDKVQDVTVEVHGVIPTMLHYGDIMIQTAGESPRFHFDDIP
ncbi:MAG: PH domain-containing protein, partial [bacterium]